MEMNKNENKTSFFSKIKSLLEDKKKRKLYLLLFILPFILLIGFFGFKTYQEVKGLLELATGNSETKKENIIESMNYVLRDNATDIQKEYFAELKNAIEVNYDDNSVIAGLVCKNFVTDFYTWTNKQGQYDVGGLYYVYDCEDVKTNTYIQARDGFYRLINKYINDYGQENLIEVENVTVTSSTPLSYTYVCPVNTHQYDEEIGHYYIDIDHEYEEAYDVKCTWTYKANDKFNTNNFATSMNFIVVNNEGRLEIVEASEKAIDARQDEIVEEE